MFNKLKRQKKRKEKKSRIPKVNVGLFRVVPLCEVIVNYDMDNTITILPSITSLPLNFLLQDGLILF